MPFRFRYLGLALFLVSLTPEADAQEPDTLDAYRELNEEVRDLPLSGRVYFSQLEEAWDRAVVAGRYGRADSVAVLAELYLVETTGTARESVVWPSRADRLALAFLRADVGAFDWLIEDGRWWQIYTPQATYYGEVVMVRPMIGAYWFARGSTLSVFERDRDGVLNALRDGGASEEQVAVASLAIDKMLDRPMLAYTHMEPPSGQKERNQRADTFLDLYPGSRYESFIRKEIREVYDVQGSISMYLGLGVGGARGDLGEATGVAVAGEIGLGIRYGWGHADIGFHGTDAVFKRDIDGTGRDYIAEGERLTVGLLGVDVGPRIAIGGLDVLPYVSGGLLLQNISARGENAETRSTYEPPTTLGYGYGLALEYLSGRSTRFGGTAVRLRVGQIQPRFTRGFEDQLPGPAAYASLGVTLSGILRSRQM